MTFTTEELAAIGAATAAIGGIVVRYLPRLFSKFFGRNGSGTALTEERHEAICSPRLAEIRVQLAAVIEHERHAGERVESIDKKIDLLLEQAMRR